MALPSREECRAALHGFIALLRGAPHAPGYYDLSVEGVWRSFWPALLLMVPYTLLLPAIDPGVGAAGPGLLLGEFALQLVIWAAYLLVMMVFCRAFGLTARYAVFAVLYNWGQAVILLVTLPVMLLAAAGLLPVTVVQNWFILLLLFWLFAVTRMARIGLGAPLGIAILAGLLDPAITELLHRLVDLLL